MKELVCLSVFIILAALFAIAMVIAGFICQYKHKTPVKNSIYECGMQPVSDARIQFDIKYFHYAVIFLIFDIETIFLYPFAVIEAFIFAGLLLFGLYYAIGRKVLKWG
mgnify:CR=1 FL=1